MRKLLYSAVLALIWCAALTVGANATQPQDVLQRWYSLTLELVRHTPTYSPPVASRSFAYLGVTAFEAVATGSGELQSLAGQLNGLKPVPQREAGKTYDEALVLHAAMEQYVIQSRRQGDLRIAYRDVIPFARRVVEEFPDRVLWDPLAAPQPHRPHARRRAAGRRHPTDRHDAGAAATAARRQPHAPVLAGRHLTIDDEESPCPWTRPTRRFPARRSSMRSSRRKGYHLNQFCMSLMNPANRERYLADERAYLDAWPLTDAPQAGPARPGPQRRASRRAATSTSLRSGVPPSACRSSRWLAR